MVVETQDVLNYLGIDYADTMVTANVTRAISTADSYLKGAVGDDYPDTDPRAKELALLLIADLYTNRSSLTKSSYTVRKFVTDSLLQLRLELRRESEEASG